MTMKLHTDSHLDHALTQAQIDYLVSLFSERDAFFIETVTLPEDLGTVPCGLYGPIMGDAPVTESQVFYAKRGARAYNSRMRNSDAAPRHVRTVTVIAGPHDGLACVLYTAFGGPCAPREPGDVRREMEVLHEQRAGLHDMSDEYKAIQSKIVALREKRAESAAFWAEHALTY
jgi:hypothetical protein